jgi:hypothetical protein
MNHDPKNHSVRKIVLPSGKSIEVVRFNDETDVQPSRGLHLCPSCHSDLVQPVAWSEAEGECWELVLSCPNCWWEDEGIFSQEQVEALEEHLDDGLADMLDDLQRLAQSNMADQVDRFITALQGDHILPEDF